MSKVLDSQYNLSIKEMLGEKWKNFNKDKPQEERVYRENIAIITELTTTQVGSNCNRSRGKEAHVDRFFKILTAWEGLQKNFSLDLILTYFKRRSYFFRDKNTPLEEADLHAILEKLTLEEKQRICELCLEQSRFVVHMKKGITLNAEEREKTINILGSNNISKMIRDVVTSFMESDDE